MQYKWKQKKTFGNVILGHPVCWGSAYALWEPELQLHNVLKLNTSLVWCTESAGVPLMRRSAHVVGGLLDVVSILWSLHTAELNSSANKGQLKQLYQLVQACLPSLLRCYRVSSCDQS